MTRTALVSLSVLLLSISSSELFGEESAIVDIRKKYNQIESYKMDSTTVNFELEDDPLSGKITYFNHNGEVKKIVFESGAEHGGSTATFYYSNDQIFFVLKTESTWSFTGKNLANGKSETVDTLKELRFYFEKDSCRRALVRNAENTKADLLENQISKVDNVPFSDAEVIKQTRESGVVLLGMKALLRG